ncbi:glycerol-3-phosphate dehydrogenase [NAD(P)+] [Synchytrium endobioticum]|uniref:Glycerol-3-phosphate dehydrogenase [NAD(+)] n=1 Tax=Synchytrium endobioticum TaxID=286115 RepID=A0A507CJY3_9FUNG|nr:glycerol-3-phosphate dehydrogenase [NAD(P)+] [Synchytrium endobioticum]TPX45286.1 glycerol-3-phosphate dehydrogenase [NAD(P)+] [Synchytrium endobioticum]
MAEKVLVLGAGNFGTCLADHLSDLGTDVTIWARDHNVVDGINQHHRNIKYMKNDDLHKNLKATSSLTPQLIKSATTILVSIPTQHMRSILEAHFTASELRETLINQLHIYVNKGIEISTGMLPYQIVDEVMGKALGDSAVYLSGPSFAAEVIKRQPTAVAVASRTRDRALRAQRLFHAPHFRVYDTPDIIGVEICGALKNVIAIAAGASVAQDFQQNTRAALITRGLAEITRIGVALGANPITFQGLAGVGDLLLTCTSEKSRNFTLGYRLGQGEQVEHVLNTLGSVAEGYETSKAAYELCRKIHADSPMVDSVYAVCHRGAPVREMMSKVMGRPPKSELYGLPGHEDEIADDGNYTNPDKFVENVVEMKEADGGRTRSYDTVLKAVDQLEDHYSKWIAQVTPVLIIHICKLLIAIWTSFDLP